MNLENKPPQQQTATPIKRFEPYFHKAYDNVMHEVEGGRYMLVSEHERDLATSDKLCDELAEAFKTLISAATNSTCDTMVIDSAKEAISRHASARKTI
jgi:hypothetical protein